jgi:hypothetical protein
VSDRRWREANHSGDSRWRRATKGGGERPKVEASDRRWRRATGGERSIDSSSNNKRRFDFHGGHIEDKVRSQAHKNDQ